MKSFILLVVLGSTAAVANDTIRDGLKVLNNPAGTVNSIDCDPSKPWCQDLFKHACSIKKTQNKLGSLDRMVSDKYWRKLPAKPEKKLYNNTAMEAISTAEKNVFSMGKVNKAEVDQLFFDAKAVLLQAVGNDPAIPIIRRANLQKNLSAVKLLTGLDYIKDLEEWARKQDPKMNADDRRHGAIQMYTSTCGANGLEVNAFYENGNIVLCPGLIYSLEDYGPKSKDEILNALSFTIGHELSHSIEPETFPDVYSKFGLCFTETTKNSKFWNSETAGELSGDYWGAKVLASRIRVQGVRGGNTARTVGLSIDGFCSETSGRNSPQPSTAFRVNNSIARTPEIRESLGCGSLSVDAPACTLAGAIPK